MTALTCLCVFYLSLYSSICHFLTFLLFISKGVFHLEAWAWNRSTELLISKNQLTRIDDKCFLQHLFSNMYFKILLSVNACPDSHIPRRILVSNFWHWTQDFIHFRMVIPYSQHILTHMICFAKNIIQKTHLFLPFYFIIFNKVALCKNLTLKSNDTKAI